MTDTCASCKFSAESSSPHWPELECRRRPPTIGGRPAAEWPNVGIDGWCGEFEAKVSAPKRRPAAGTGDVETR